MSAHRRTYLRAPSFDPEFDMADFLVLVTKDTARQRYLERLERSLALG